jgi:hypothetical protein
MEFHFLPTPKGGITRCGIWMKIPLFFGFSIWIMKRLT